MKSILFMKFEDGNMTVNNDKMAELSYEDAVKRLEEIVNLLEQGEASLEESLDLFKEGMALSKICEQKLAAMEEEISKLQLTSEGKIEEKAVEFLHE
ncbi:MAG TPA: exodeoxyribonuclease VII small subunit [Bacillota bacterium]|nr:exodeoxyribonuclease VII small subunit [Bacillota bacterium]